MGIDNGMSGLGRSGHAGLAVSVEPSPERCVIRVAGELEQGTVGALVAEARGAAPQAPLELDLRGVTFMDGRGIRALESIVLAAARNAVPVSITHVDPNVARVLRLAGGDAIRSRLSP